MHPCSRQVWQKSCLQKKKHRLVLLRVGPCLPPPHHRPCHSLCQAGSHSPSIWGLITVISTGRCLHLRDQIKSSSSTLSRALV